MLGHRALNAEEYLSILKRRWWIIAIPSILLPIVAIGATFFVTPQFMSTAVVLIGQQKVPTSIVKPVATDDIDSRVAYMEEQVLSRASLQPIIEKYNLYASQHLSMDARIELFRKTDLKVGVIPSDFARSNGLPGFQIQFTASDPHTAQQVCSDITSLFTTVNLRSRQANAEGTTDFLKQQLDKAQQTLNDQDAKVAAFQRQYSGMLPGDEANNMGILSSLQSQLEAATQSIQSLEQNQSMIEALLAQSVQSSPSTPGAVVQTPQAQQIQLDALEAKEADLATRYTDDYPEVKTVRRQIADLQKEMAKASMPAPVTPATSAPNRTDSAAVVQLRAQLRGYTMAVQAKRKQQDDLTQEIRSYQGRIQATPQIEAQYKEITRDHDTAQTFYNQLLDEINHANMTTDLEQQGNGETLDLLDAANLPMDPIFPKTGVFAMGGFGAGLAIGTMIVAFLEYKDTAMSTERDVWSFTQLPTLAVIAWSGEVAEIKPGRLERLKRLFSRKPKDLLADAPG